ncbi:MAG: HEAT repeat domain-containing protein [Aetokthonos hydrillicola CCALA 1050]|nr:HEAT repeat domain-containing protein [Aetokthonos hydrillicola CCALA 1050]
MLKDDKADANVRRYAASALSNFGTAGAKYIPDILTILKDDKADANLRRYAASALSSFGTAGTKYIPDILTILKDDKADDNLRRYAASALSNFGTAGAKYIPDILTILKDDKADANLRRYAASALSSFGTAGTKYIPDILTILKDDKADANLRSYAASALSSFGTAGTKYIPDILTILKDDKADANVRGEAARALSSFGTAGAKYIPDILTILKDDNASILVGDETAKALSSFGAAGAKYIPDILSFLKDDKASGYGRRYAASALSSFGTAGTKYIPDILTILKDDKADANIRGEAASALKNVRQLDLQEVIIILNYTEEPNQGEFSLDHGNFEYWRFLTYFLGGGTDEVKTLLTWLGNPKETPHKLTNARGEGVKTLELFLKIWDISKGLRLQKNLAQQIAEVANKVPDWKLQDITLLQTHYENLKKGGYNDANTVVAVINNLEFWKWFFLAKTILLIHFAIWLTLILTYPKFPQVLAIFFWNLWLRRIVGFGYIGLLLICVPWLRQRLFAPFKRSLLVDARLDNFNDQDYFKKSFTKVPPGTPPPEIQPITQALPTLKGQIVLEGDSGLGKSMFLRHLVKNSQRTVVYLPAQKCDQGVIEAIQAKLKEQVQDTKFLKKLICLGAIDICIDGLNEVTADTRAKISQFVENSFQGNIIMTTQPLEWIPPSTAKTYELQPLNDAQEIQEFLISRQPSLLQENQSKKTDYQQACIRYIAEVFNDQQPPEDLEAAKRILSNPMDLTLVGLMLAQGEQPDLFRLQAQQYRLMAAEYQQKWKHEFPLPKFSQLVYQMRLNDESAIPKDEFEQELISMEDEKYKMVVSRQWKNLDGEPQKSWYFRHDKIMEFFLVQNFLGKSEEVESRINEHLGDPRFRGVYLLLANLLPLEVALELREKLIQHAVNTKDYTLVGTFVQLLTLRSPQWKQDDIQQLLRNQEQKTKSLDLAVQFLELLGAKVKRKEGLYLTIETIEGRLSTYTPLPVVLTIDTPTDRDVNQLVQVSEKLPLDYPQRVAILFYKVSPDTTARIEMAKVRLRDRFVLIPIPLTSVEKALPDQNKCRGLLEEYVDRYLQRADFFDDRNAISDTFSFFGRTELLERLREELIRYQGIGLFGLRKSGKTSVLFQLGFLLREHPVVHIDLQQYGGSRYGAELFNHILQSLYSLESDTMAYSEPLPKNQPAAELKAEFIRRINDFALAIEKSKKYKLPILCFVDEVERIIPHQEDSREKAEEFNACFEALRVLIQKHRQMSLLVADVHPDCNRINNWNQQGVATNPVFEFFKEVFLSPFSTEETTDMLTNIGELMGLEFDETTLTQIHQQSGGHPFVSRQLTRFLTQKINDKNTNSSQGGHILIEWAMVERFVDKVFSQKGELRNYFERSIWEDLEKRQSEVAISVLQVLACNENSPEKVTAKALLKKLQGKFTDDQCLDACTLLTNVGLLYHGEVNNEDCYYIRVPLLSRWIQMRMTQEEIEEWRICQ